MAKTRQNNIPAEWIDDIPVQGSAFKAGVVSLAAIMLAGLGAAAALVCPDAFRALLDRNAEVAILLDGNGLASGLKVCFSLMAVLGFICAACGLISLIRIRLTYRILCGYLMVAYPLLIAYILIVWKALFAVLAADIDIDGSKQDRATVLLLWWRFCWPALAAMLYVAWLHAMLRSRSVYAAFTGRAGDPLVGDIVLEDIRTHGRDPRARRSLYASVFTHILILIIIPALTQMGGCVEGYKVPKGSGNPVVAMVKMVKPKKKKKKSMTLRPNSAILYEIPDLDNTEVDQKMEEQTQVTYQAMANAKAGKMGKGGGTEGGWPEGMDDYKIRFIRLDHGGSGWDDGMGESGADINFLRAFAKNTGFKKIASGGESHSIRLLSKYKSDEFPPFVYLTGDVNMGRVSSDDIKILREYCLNGGMLIADAGSESFHRSFKHFITRQVFYDKQLLDISDDDMIYQLPYGFPNGAPAFWHHGGRRAMGMKHEGRWMVFYHPGDMNDAWKSPGFTDVKPEMRDAAMQLGINLVYYAFNQWDDAVMKARK